MYAQLLIDLFKYLAPFLRNVELNKPMQILYKVRAHLSLTGLSLTTATFCATDKCMVVVLG